MLRVRWQFYFGSKVKNLRKRNFKLRQKLQTKGTKSAKRKLKQRRRKESRKDTRKTVCKTMRQALSSWSFYQLRQFIEYKAQAAGVLVIYVEPRNSTCSKCGYVDKNSRKDQEHFVCTACGYALNIARRGAEVIQTPLFVNYHVLS